MGSIGSRSSGSFYSAAGSFNDGKFNRKDWELKMKTDKQNKKKFNEVRKMVNKEEQGREFGQLVDLRASDPVKVSNMLKTNKQKKEAKKKDNAMKR